MRFRQLSRIALAITSVFAISVQCLAQVAVLGPSGQDASRQESKDYRLAPYDQITVIVLNHPELSGDMLIPEGGILIFPEVGPHNVNGMTLVALSQYLQNQYGKELLSPNVSVLLKAPRVQQISVGGDVQKPGAMPLTRGMRLADALNAAGGLLPDVKQSDVILTILERDGTRLQESMQAATSGDPASNIVLHDGDSVSADAGTFNVYVIGQVKNPGLQRLTRGASVLEAISTSGGALTTAAISNVHVTHINGSGEEIINLVPALVHGDKTPMPPLRSGDLINIPQSTDQYSILGYVSQAGTYQIPEGQTVRLTDAFAQAHGHDQQRRARLSRVVVVRMVNGQEQHTIYDLGKFLKFGDQTQNPVIYSGDVIYVPETNQISATTILTALAAAGVIYTAVKR